MKRFVLAALCALTTAKVYAAGFDFRTTGTTTTQVVNIKCSTTPPPVSETAFAKWWVPCAGVTGYTAGHIYISQNGGPFRSIDDLLGTGGGGSLFSVFGRNGDVTASSGDYNASQITLMSAVNGQTTTQSSLSDLNSRTISNTSSIASNTSAIASNTSAIATKAPLSRTITAGTGLSGGGDLSADRTLALANTAVSPGSYTAANVTVDAQGRLTSAAAAATTGTGTTFALQSSPTLVLADQTNSTLGVFYKSSISDANRYLHTFSPGGSAVGRNVFHGISSGNFGGSSGLHQGLAITAATNTSPIVITTSTPIGVWTGAQVAISGVGGNTAANGNWTVTLVDPACCFSLDTSNGTSSGAYVPSTGSVTWAYQASDNVAIGAFTGTHLTSGHSNLFAATNAGTSCTTCWGNVLLGVDAGASVISSYELVAIAPTALTHATTAHTAAAVGASALLNCTSCSFAAAFAPDAAQGCTTCTNIAAFGTNALNNNQTGAYEAAGGSGAATAHMTSNIATWGAGSLANNIDGDLMAGLGRAAGVSDIHGTKNTYVGGGSDTIGGSFTNSAAIGANSRISADNMVQLGDSNLTMVRTYGHYFETQSATYMGQTQNVAYASGNFTANGGGTFGVDSGDQSTFYYSRIGDQTIINIQLANVTISGSPTDLAIALPFTPSSTSFSTWLYTTASKTRVLAFVIGGQAAIHIQKDDLSAFASGTNTVGFGGQIFTTQ